MKKLLLIFAISLIFVGCKKEDFLDRFPLTSFSEQNFFKNENDLKLFVNQFYTSLPTQRSIGDAQSDIQANRNINSFLAGTYIVPTSGGWNWSAIRSTNYFIVRALKAAVPDAIKTKYLGEVRFFRALYYWNMVAAYGDVPWINKDLNDESPELFAARDPRNMVMDSVLQDLNFAIAATPAVGSAEVGRINKDIALALKSRICLWEGTYRKYHATGNADTFLAAAVEASQQLITSGRYGIYTAGDPQNDYRNLFIQEDLTRNTESILSRRYIKDIVMHGFTRTVSENGFGYSKALIKTYLCKDGLPISVSPLYKGDNTYDDELTDRDPRLTQTIPARGYQMFNDGSDTFTIPRIGLSATSTGYQPIKYRSSVPSQFNANQSTLDLFIFRYAEVLLNYAEAKAEQGTLTQNDLDISINLLRDRVDMPRMTLATLVADPKTLYPTVSIPVQEIRRERAIELVGEGFRFYDILRWKAGSLINNPESIQGIRLTSTMKALYPASQIGNIQTDPISECVRVYPNITTRTWDDKMYLFPLSLEQLTLNTNLKQNPGW